ncbi:MAG TPA: hypothetical protein VIX15_05165, partial [Streptosporangiaceae bacterium]
MAAQSCTCWFHPDSARSVGSIVTRPSSRRSLRHPATHYALEALHAAARSGAATVVLCDTNGGALPWIVEDRARAVRATIGVSIGIHAHDDSGCAVASSLAAVLAGATHVQGTVNGYGERCGNANLCTLAATLELKLGRGCLAPGALAELTRVSRHVAEIANLATDAHAPY